MDATALGSEALVREALAREALGTEAPARDGLDCKGALG